MSALSVAAYRWRSNNLDDMPRGVSVTPIDVESGRGASRSVGKVHFVADAAVITDGEFSRLVGVWVCGGSTIDMVEVPDDGDTLCETCELSVRLPQCPCVYRAWDAGGELLYIGSTINPAQRVLGHRRSTIWWSDVARLDFEEYETESEARHAESAAIWEAPGKHNKFGVKRPGGPFTALDGIEVSARPGDPA